MEQAIEWTEKASKVLRKLLGVLDLTIKAWEGFTSEDAHYFSNMPFPLGPDVQWQSCRSLQLIHERFRRLRSLQERFHPFRHVPLVFNEG